MRILALTKYGNLAASTRQRFSQYAPWLEAEGITLEISPLLDDDYLRQRFSIGSVDKVRIIRSYVSRLMRLVRKGNYDMLWVHCEMFPYFPSPFEYFARLPGTPIVYDFDDAIFHHYDLHSSIVVRSILGNKTVPLLRSAQLAICGNSYLEEWAGKYCHTTTIIPTVVNVAHYGPAIVRPALDLPRIGWIGSPSTWSFMLPQLRLLREFVSTGQARVRVVGAGPATREVSGFETLDWCEETEVQCIQGMDIGIMPLPDTPWARGKCGYKLIQYMACGLPVVASPVGVNRDIVEHGVNGFLAETETEWSEALSTLLGDRELRQRFGVAGRKKVEKEYSLQVFGPRIACIMRNLEKSSLSE